MVCIDSFELQTMTAFYQKFLRGGPGGGSFFKKRPPLAAGGNSFNCPGDGIFCIHLTGLRN